MKSSTKNIACELPHELPKDLRLYPHGIFTAGGAYVPTQEKKKRLRILGNSEIMGKTQKWVEAEPST